MTIEEYIWDVKEIKGLLTDDSDIEDMWILHKLNMYRAIHIVNEYNLTNEIDPIWLQRIYKFRWKKCNASDDPNIIYNSITLGKYIFPKIINLKEGLGNYRISGSGSIIQFESCGFDRLMMKLEIGEETNGQYGYFSKIGDTIYISPYIPEGSATIIAENPLDVPINDNGTFRNMEFTDEYPLDAILAQKCILDLLTKDMAISDKSITDIVNDSQNEFKILKDAIDKN